MKHNRLLCLFVALIMCLTSAAFAENYEKLQRGDRGSDVLKMQQALSDLGYSLSVDGKFGAGTEKTVKSFQKDQHLSVDGVAGNKTLTRLYELTEEKENDHISAPGKLQRGDSGEEVRALQNALKKLGYRLSADGKYGQDTENAVRAFQLINNIQVDGIAGKQTQALIFSQASGGGQVNPTVQPVVTPYPVVTNPPYNPPENPVYHKLKYGSSGPEVKALQEGLIQLGYRISADGKYGRNTQSAVKSFQRDQRLSVDGIAGAKTQSRLFELLSGSRPPVTPLPTAIPQGGQNAQVTTGGGYLNLREKPERWANVVSTIPNYTYIHVLERGNVWSRVSYNGLNGYVMSSFLTFSAEIKPEETIKPVQPTEKPATPGLDLTKAMVYTKNGGPLNIRQSASSSAKVIGSIPNGTALQVNQYGSTWCAVTYQGQNGYVMTKFLTFKEQTKPTTVPTLRPSETVKPTVSPTQKPSYDTDVLNRTLRVGSKGDDVKLVQQRLAALNYLSAGYITGTYGEETKAAVELFQKIHALKKDGIAGKDTFSRLFSDTAIPYTSELEGYSTLHIYYKHADPELKDDIERVQKRLNALGYGVPTTGKFDSTTYMAVLSFQLRNGLVVDGAVGPSTQAILFSNGAKGPTAPASYELEEGAGYIQGPDTSEVQFLHWYNEIKPSLKGSDELLIYDPDTRLSWHAKVFSPGHHADSQPSTLRDTLIMFRSFGKPSWNVQVVYVQLPDGRWTMASMHNYPHLTGSIRDNGFDGHLCIHFRRDLDECAANDPDYGMNNQEVMRDAWKKLTGEEVK